MGAVHYSASAKQNKGVQELFLDLSKSKCICCMVMLIGNYLLMYVGILDFRTNLPSAPGSEAKSSFVTQGNSRRSIIVEDDLRATQSNSDRGTGGGGGCC